MPGTKPVRRNSFASVEYLGASASAWKKQPNGVSSRVVLPPVPEPAKGGFWGYINPRKWSIFNKKPPAPPQNPAPPQPVEQLPQQPTRFQKVIETGVFYALVVMDKADTVFKTSVTAIGDGITFFPFASYMKNYQKDLCADKRIALAETKMTDSLKDPTFLELCRLVRVNVAKRGSALAAHEIQTFLKDRLFYQIDIPVELIDSLIQVNLTNGFANIATTLSDPAIQLEIPNFQNQNVLENLAALVLNRLKKYDPLLSALEKSRLEASAQYQQQFSKYDQLQPKRMEVSNAEALHKALIQSESPFLILQEFFPRYKFLSHAEKLELEKVIQNEAHINQQINAVFNQLTDDFFKLFFPNQMNDVIFPGSELGTVQNKTIQTFVLKLIKSQIAQSASQIYHDHVRPKNQDPNQPKIELSTVFLKEITRSLLNHPDAIRKVTVALDLTHNVFNSGMQKVHARVYPTLAAEMRPDFSQPASHDKLAITVVAAAKTHLLADDSTLITTIAKDAFTLTTAAYDLNKTLDRFVTGVNGLIPEQEKRILKSKDPQFFQLYQFVRDLILFGCTDELTKKANGALKDQPIVSKVEIKKEFIQSLIKINIAYAFANLAEKGVIVELVGKLQKQMDKLSELEVARQKAKALFVQLENIAIADKLKARKLFAKLLPPEPKTDVSPVDLEEHLLFPTIVPQDIVKELFPNYAALSAEQQQKINEMVAFAQQASEISQVYARLFDEFLVLLFPNRLNDLILPIMPQTIKLDLIQNSLYKLISRNCFQFLHHPFIQFLPSPSNQTKWIKTVQNKTGLDPMPLLQAPLVGAFEFTKAFVLSDMHLTEMMSQALHWIEDSQVPPDQQKQLVLASQQHRPLAQWIIQSLQGLLDSKDPALQKAGTDLKNYTINLLLGLLVNGSEIALPDDRNIDKDKFINTLVDLTIAKIKSMLRENQVLTENTVQSLLKDFPLPPFIKKIVIQKICEKKEYIDQALCYVSTAVQQVQTAYEQALLKMQLFSHGKELIVFYEKLADIWIEQAPKGFKSLVSADKGWNANQIEDLLAEFFPGIELNDGFKAWFKENLEYLAKSIDKNHPNSLYALLKKGIVASMMKSTLNFFETNEVPNPDKFIAQTFHRAYETFVRPFSTLDLEAQQKLHKAADVVKQINELKKERDELRQEIVKAKGVLSGPNLLSKEENEMVHAVLIQSDRLFRASRNVVELVCQLTAKFQVLGFAGREFEEKRAYLNKVRKALALQQQVGLSSETRALETELEKLIRLGLQDVSTIELYKVLIELSKLSQADKKLLEECLNIEATLQVAKQHEKAVEKSLKEVREHLTKMLPNASRAFSSVVHSMEHIIGSKPILEDLDQQIAEKESALLPLLAPFKGLTTEWMTFLGLNKLGKEFALLFDLQKDEKDKNGFQKFIESKASTTSLAAEELGARFLFEQIYPVMKPILDSADTYSKLEASTGSPFLGHITKFVSEEAVKRAPEFLGYKAAQDLVQIIPIIGGGPTKEELFSINLQINLFSIQMGRKSIDKDKIVPLIQNWIPLIDQDRLSKSLVELLHSNHLTFNSGKALLPQLKDHQIASLIQSLDRMALELGRKALTPHILVQAVQKALPPNRVKDLSDGDNFEDVLEKMEKAKIIDKIQVNLPIPDEHIDQVRDLFPELQHFQSLILPQLKELLKSEKNALNHTLTFFQKYIEGMVAKELLRIVENNGPRNILDKMSQKLLELVSSEEIRGLSQEDAAEWILDNVMTEIVGIRSESDLQGIPTQIKPLVFAKLKESIKLYISPFVYPLINKETDRHELDKISKSKFLSHLCTAITKDTINWIVPTTFKSYTAVSQKILKELGGVQPISAEKATAFTMKIGHIVERSKYKPNDPQYIPRTIQRSAIVTAFQEATGTELSVEQRKAHMAKLKAMKVRDELNNIVITPESIFEVAIKSVPEVDGVKSEMATELQKLTRLGSVSTNPHVTQFAQQILETFLVKFFIIATKKNPPQPGKDAVILIIEKFLELAKTKLRDIKDSLKRTEERYHAEIVHAVEGPAREQKIKEKEEALRKEVAKGAQALVTIAMKDVLGIESPAALEGIPASVQSLVYDLIKNLLLAQTKKLVVTSYNQLQSLNTSDKGIKEAQDNLSKLFGGAYAEIVSRDIGRLIVDSSLHTLNKKGGELPMGVTLVGDSTRTYLEELARDNVEIARVLLGYSRTPALDRILGSNLRQAQRAPDVDKAQISELIGNAILTKTNLAIDKMIEKEKLGKETFDRKIATNLLHVATDYFKFINEAKKQSQSIRGNDKFTHEDFVNAAGEKLDPAVPRKRPNYQNSIREIKQRLRMADPWTADQESKLKKALEKLVADEEDVIRPIKVELLIPEIEKILEHSLTEAQRKRLKKQDDKGLTIKDIIRQDAEAGNQQRIDQMYGPGLKKLLKLFFPNGSADLTFITPDLRKVVWKLIKVKPEMVIILLETVFDRDKLTDVVINTMEATLRNLKEEPVVDLSVENPELDELDHACGAMMAQMLDFTKLPDLIVRQLRNPKTGEIYPAKQKMLGRAMRKHFNGEFIQKNLKVAFQTMAKRTDRGKSIFAFDFREDFVKNQERERLRPEKDAKISSLTRDLVDATIEFNLKGLWRDYKARLDRWMDQSFGKIETKLGPRVGAKLKHALEAVGRFLFNLIVGAVFSIAHWTTSQTWIKQKIYEFINLEENKNLFMKLLREDQLDQPGKSNYPVHLEHFTYQALRTVEQSIA